MRKATKIQLLGVITLSFVLTACNGGKNQTNIELVQAMFDQESIKAQDWDPKNPNKQTMLTPPKGTIPRGFTPYKYSGDPDFAEKSLKNPLFGKYSPEVIKEGHESYQIYCSICHGTQGAGDGKLAEYMPLKPPSLVSDKVKNFKDGRIFHIITDGQGVMGNYANQIVSPRTRWAVVNYIRTLQKKIK